MRELPAGTEWAYRTRAFARALRGAAHGPGGLLLVGTPNEDPWHLTAHLDDEALYAEIPELSPVLVRHRVPEGAPPHLAVDLRRLEVARSPSDLNSPPADSPAAPTTGNRVAGVGFEPT